MFRLVLSRCIKLRVAQSSTIYKSTDLVGTTARSLFYKHDSHLLQRVLHGGVLLRNETQSYSDDTSSQVTDGSENILETTRKEIANLLAIGWQAPENISDPDIEHYLTLESKKGRKKFLRFLGKKEVLKKKDKMKKEENAKQRALLKESKNPDDDDPFPNRFFLRVHTNTIMQFDKSRLATGMMFGPKIAFDFSYEDLMRKQEVISLVQQLMYGLNANKLAKDPFNVHWVGLTPETQSLPQLKRVLGDALETTMVNHTDKDLLDVFPKEDLIYLSADSPNVLKTFDSDKVYVVGALVDRNIIYTGQSLARAKRFGLDHARLPLDKHLQWATGAKNLTLDQVMKILIEMNTSGDWVKALQHVPIRKHAGLRSGPHWNQDRTSNQAKSGDGIQRSPSHFVSSRTKQTKNSTKTHDGEKRQQKRLETEDDTDSTLFSSGPKSWFNDGQ